MQVRALAHPQLTFHERHLLVIGLTGSHSGTRRSSDGSHEALDLEKQFDAADAAAKAALEQQKAAQDAAQQAT